jgi:hypothetical protein
LVTPIFIFSLPRSGSTLSQRILAAHHDVSTVSESHILLPYFYTLREHGVYSEYFHAYTAKGIRAFCNELPNGEDDYLQEIRKLILRLYTKAAKDNARYFVDKAGAYHLIVEEIIQLFDDAKFIFLWRNPLSVISSLMESWKDGKWNLHEHYIYLFEGLSHLVAAYQRHSEHVCSARYEDLVSEPAKEWPRMFEYLGLQFEPEFLSRFADIELHGDLGDRPGIRRYRALSTEPIAKWKVTLSNPIRKIWCRRYLEFIGHERLAVMGYELESLLADLRSVPVSLRYLRSDLLNVPYGVAYRFMEGKIMKDKLKRWRAGQRIYLHH